MSRVFKGLLYGIGAGVCVTLGLYALEIVVELLSCPCNILTGDCNKKTAACDKKQGLKPPYRSAFLASADS